MHEIFTQNIIVSAITFHGGTNVIGYPWGSYNRADQINYDSFRSREAPDQKALNDVGIIMKELSGGRIVSKTPEIDEYIFGPISTTIYPVNGGLEDWAYAAGWDTYPDRSTNY